MPFSEEHALPESISLNCQVVCKLILQWIGCGQEVWSSNCERCRLDLVLAHDACAIDACI